MVNVFSFCLYNSYNLLYYEGILQNIALIQTHFPEFYTYIYIGNDVPDDFVIRLRGERNVILRFTHATGPVNMIHRFFAIDEPEVDIMFVRDADSRVHWKDRWAIKQFLNSAAMVHIIRDNPGHTTAIMGGLWGMRKLDGMKIQSLYEDYKRIPAQNHGMGLDQDFLIDCVYPKIVNVMMIHSSITWKFRPFEVLHEFPFQYTNDIYCGRVERIEQGAYKEPPAPPNAVPKLRPQSIIDQLNHQQRLTKLY